MESKALNALVTGATGFLGLYIVEQLRERGDNVRVLCRQPTDELRRMGVEIVTGDLCDSQSVIEACRDVSTVYHVAGVAGIWGKWSHYYSVNVQGTANVLHACWSNKVSKLVYTSSPSVTFDGSEQCGIDESVPYPRKWQCHYPHSKAIAEQLVLNANYVDGLQTCSLRPHLIWGPRDRHLIPRLVKRAASGQLRQVGDGSNLVDMVFVENAARAHLQAADALGDRSPVAGRAYFISQGEPVNCWEWINEVLGLAGLPPIRRRISFRLAWWLGGALETVYAALRIRSEPRMTRFLAAQLAKSHYFSIRRAKEDFGFSPTISIAEGMERLAKSLRAPTR